jgi:hypothetical protein
MVAGYLRKLALHVALPQRVKGIHWAWVIEEPLTSIPQ